MLAQIMRKNAKKISADTFRFFLNCYPPFLGAGIRVKSISKNYQEVTVELKLSWYNRNYVGTQFGGSLYAMTDPFFMLMIMNNLGSDYVVWDKAAAIDFKKPGKGKVTANFKITESLLNEVRQKTSAGEKYIFDLPVEIEADDGEVIASVIKTLYVRQKMK